MRPRGVRWRWSLIDLPPICPRFERWASCATPLNFWNLPPRLVPASDGNVLWRRARARELPVADVNVSRAGITSGTLP